MEEIITFIHGAKYVFKGIRAYYSDNSLWWYGLLPLLLLLPFYFFVFFCCFYFLEGWIFYAGLLAALFLVPLTISLLYEFAGGFFFDLLIAKYVKKNSFPLPVQEGERFFIFLIDTLKFNLGTFFLTLVLLPLSLFLPLAGQILLLLFIGNRNGKVWLLPALYFYGKRYETSKDSLAEKKLLVTGFGVFLTIMVSVPFAALFLLPSFALGGLLLVKENFLQENN